jgi:hypothetical protein
MSDKSVSLLCKPQKHKRKTRMGLHVQSVNLISLHHQSTGKSSAGLLPALVAHEH